MKRDLEALLFATESPLALPRLRALFPEAAAAELRAALAELRADYDQAGHAFTIVEFGGGWQIATRPEYAPLIHRLYGGRRHLRLSRASLETLAIIAYRQPLTRLEIEDIRGVQTTGVLATLLERNLVAVVGRAETVGHPILYGTTREFLAHLGLQSISQLPPLPDLEGLLGDREGLKQFALQLGQELTDDDFEPWQMQDEEAGVLDLEDQDAEAPAAEPAAPAAPEIAAESPGVDEAGRD